MHQHKIQKYYLKVEKTSFKLWSKLKWKIEESRTSLVEKPFAKISKRYTLVWLCMFTHHHQFPPLPKCSTHGKEPSSISSFLRQERLHSVLFISSSRSYVRLRKTRSKRGKEQIPVLDHLLSIIQLPPNNDTTFLSCSWAALVVLPHIRWENTPCFILKEILSVLSKTFISHSLLFHEKVTVNFSPFLPISWIDPLRKRRWYR